MNFLWHTPLPVQKSLLYERNGTKLRRKAHFGFLMRRVSAKGNCGVAVNGPNRALCNGTGAGCSGSYVVAVCAHGGETDITEQWQPRAVGGV